MGETQCYFCKSKFEAFFTRHLMCLNCRNRRAWRTPDSEVGIGLPPTEAPAKIISEESVMPAAFRPGDLVVVRKPTEIKYQALGDDYVGFTFVIVEQCPSGLKKCVDGKLIEIPGYKVADPSGRLLPHDTWANTWAEDWLQKATPSQDERSKSDIPQEYESRFANLEKRIIDSKIFEERINWLNSEIKVLKVKEQPNFGEEFQNKLRLFANTLSILNKDLDKTNNSVTKLPQEISLLTARIVKIEAALDNTLIFEAIQPGLSVWSKATRKGPYVVLASTELEVGVRTSSPNNLSEIKRVANSSP